MPGKNLKPQESVPMQKQEQYTKGCYIEIGFNKFFRSVRYPIGRTAIKTI